MNIGFLGAGKVGFTLGRFFTEEGLPLTGYYNRHREAAEEAARFTGSAMFESMQQLVQMSDVIFFTVPDGAVIPVYRSIPKDLLAGKQLCHCSGALTAEDAFPGAAQAGASILSIHPLFPVSSKSASYRELKGAFFCLEGDTKCVHAWSERLHGFGCPTISVRAADKVRYHAACTISSNLVCALVQESLDLLAACGLSEQTALRALTPLIRSNLEHILEVGPQQALTGPVERNDTGTVAGHLKAIERRSDLDLYRAGSERLTEMAEQRHPDRDYSAMHHQLEKES